MPINTRGGAGAHGSSIVGQSRVGSLIEALVNVAIGLLVSVAANAVVFPHFGFRLTVGDNVAISLIYTAISIVRQYVLRRWFNARLQRAAARLGQRVEHALYNEYSGRGSCQ